MMMHLRVLAFPHGLVAPNGNSWMSAFFSSNSPYSSSLDAVTDATNLSYLNLVATPGSGSVTFGGGGSIPRLAFTPFANAADGSAVDAYYSFAFRLDSLADTRAAGGLIASFNNIRGSQSGTLNTAGAALYAKASGAGFVLGVLEQGTDETQATYDTTVLGLGQTHFVVGKYTIRGTLNLGGASPTTDDSAQIWINPTSLGGAEPAGALVGVNERTDVPTNQTDGFVTIQSFSLRQAGTATAPFNSATSIVVDELRIGTTYADVTPTSMVVEDDADFDGDGDVDGADFLTWQRGLGKAGDKPDGDADNSGQIDGADLAVWRMQFGPGAVPAAGAIPEPASLLLAAAGLLAAVMVRRNVL